MKTATANEKETRSGRLIDLLNIEPQDIDIRDIAVSLSHINRFDGHSGLHYSVAQHSVVVGKLLSPEDRIHGLLHDTPEYLIGDMSSPMKCALKSICPDFPRAWKWIEGRAEVAIYAALGAALPTDEQRARVKAADMLALAIEQREIMRSPNRWNVPDAPPMRIVPEAADDARLNFLDALEACGVDVRRPSAVEMAA